MSCEHLAPIGAMHLLAANGDIARCDAPYKLVGYAGLGARVHSSGEEHYGGRITKAGPPRHPLHYGGVRIVDDGGK